MALATAQELATFMDRSVKTARAELAISAATSVIWSYIGADPEPFVGSRVAYLSSDTGTVMLPVLLDTVVSVTDIDDGALDYTWRGGRALTLDSTLDAFTFQRDSVTVDEVKVTYTYATVPTDLRNAALVLAASIYGPSGVSGGTTVGIQSESIDDYTVRYSESSSTSTTAGSAVPVEAQMLLARFQPAAFSIRMRTT